MSAFTASSWPIIAAEKIVGRAPCVSRKSAIALLPTCAAASMHVSQSPKPQSTDARASAGCFSTASRTRAKLPCDAPTISRTRFGSCDGNASAPEMTGGGGGAWPQAVVAIAGRPSEKKKRLRDSGMNVTSPCSYRKARPFRARQFDCRRQVSAGQSVGRGGQDMLTHGALELLDYRAFEARQFFVGDHQAIGPQMRF